MRRLIKNPIKRNTKCPCGSGKKVKHCCMEDIQAMEVMHEAGMDQGQIKVARLLGHMPGEPPVVPQISGEEDVEVASE